MIITSVLFDMDGLLLDTEQMAYRAWKKAGQEQGYVITKELYKRCIGCGQQKSKKILIDFFGLNFPYEKIRKQRLKYTKEEIERNGIPVKPGAAHLLKWLKQQGITTAVATSTISSQAVPMLEETGLFQYFDRIVTGEMVAKGKPDPQIYLEAARQLGCRAEECLVLEDSPYGLEAAYSAGMNPVMIPDLVKPGKREKEICYAIFNSLLQVSFLITSVQ